jgi:hypothetical protein
LAREDKDFRDACMISRLMVRKDATKLEEAIHRAKLLMAADPAVVEQVFINAQAQMEARRGILGRR